MEKVLLRSKLVLENGIKLNKWFCTRKMFNHPNNQNKGFELGWNITKDGDCSPACPPDDLHGIWKCQGGQCVYIPY